MLDYREIRLLGTKDLKAHESKLTLWPIAILGSRSAEIDTGKPLCSDLVRLCACSCLTCSHLGPVGLSCTVRLNQAQQHLLAQYREGIFED